MQEMNRNLTGPFILTLDGGGIRGYVSLLILDRLMKEIAECERRHDLACDAQLGPAFTAQHPLPCHYFDAIYGTSTGGMIAVMLGRLEMPVERCLDVYRQHGGKIFGRRRLRGYIPLLSKYSSDGLERAVRRVIQENCSDHVSCNGEDAFARSSKSACSTVCVTAIDVAPSQPWLLRTTTGEMKRRKSWLASYNTASCDLSVLDVVRATTAAPVAFKPFTRATEDGRVVRFKDGAVLANNPAYVALTDCVQQKGRYPELLLSVGTGRRSEGLGCFAESPKGKWASSWRENVAALKDAIHQYTDCEHTHRIMLDKAAGGNGWYRRFNLSGIGDIPLDAWKDGKVLEQMKEAAKRDAPDVSEIVEKLVFRRRERARNAGIPMAVETG
ncbi:FabD/lysophospholipase-like protein [Corynespora cassiicola Philippines]|uniref:FabD/lysophospholipase-like protein n=1 Tax=Corynespora cassiicola Philippines TaxID=1448308 RepID=A0A2T2MZR6_CORCC|nr:FabD/lysophospholipase-like protein [Corynespora cassiicola Philippines]